MNRSARRRAASAQRRARLRDGLKTFHRETREGGFGAFQAQIVRPGTLESLTYAPMIGQWLRNAATSEKPPLCLACDHEFRRSDLPVAFALNIPLPATPSTVIVTGICELCVQKNDEDLLDVVFRHLKKMGIAAAKLASGNA